MQVQDYWLLLAFFVLVLAPAPFLGRYLYRVMEGIKAQHGDLQVTDYHLTGYSLGALNAAFVSHLDEQRKSFNFKRVLMLNPPVDLLTSVDNLDRLSRAQLRAGWAADPRSA